MSEEPLHSRIAEAVTAEADLTSQETADNFKIPEVISHLCVFLPAQRCRMSSGVHL
jgi:hypothetical protein